jgi:chromate transporter
VSAVGDNSTNWKEGIRERVDSIRAWLSIQFEPAPSKVGLKELTRTFFAMGATGFGGGFAILGNIRRVVVRQKRWMTEHEFLDAVSLAQSLPGANAANAITYIGLKLAGLKGALVSVASFLVPAFLVMLGLSIAHGYLVVFPDARRVFQGFSAAVVGLIAANTVRLGKTAVQKQWHLELGVAVGFLLIFTETTIAEVVLLSGLIGVFIHSFKSRARRRVRKKLRTKKTEPETENETQTEVAETAEATSERRLFSFAAPILLLFVALPFLEHFVIIWRLIAIFLRIGTVTFGGGYVMVPQIEADVVEVHGWLTHAEFADGMAFGQITPGPILITATFVGYKVAGISGAIAATIAAFLPSFVMTSIAGTSLKRFQTNNQVQAFLTGVAPAVVGMMAAAGVSLARSGLGSSATSYGVATLAFLLMMRARFNPVLIILGCGFLQWLISRGLIF